MCDKTFFFEQKEQLNARMQIVEDTFDGLKNKNKALENWMDIYMPLRVQRQITDTVKECLTQKGKYILGLVDKIMCNQFRKRIIQDIGHPELSKKCLAMIDKLKLEAEMLTASKA